MRRFVFLFALAGLACDPAVVEEMDASRPPRIDGGPDAGPPADLDGYIEWQMAAGGIPGAAASIVKNGAIAWTGTYGYADIASERFVDTHSLFPVASLSKTVVAARVMQLVEMGLLDLDEPIETYVGYSVRHPSFASVPITLRMLLTHTSGLEDDFLALGMLTTNGDTTLSLAEFSEGYVTPGGAYYSADNWGAQPGTRRSYCNAAFALVGDAIERAGAPTNFRDQVRTGIFEPLAMDGAGFFLADVDAAQLATPYSFSGTRFYAVEQKGFPFYPAGTLRVSITGLSRFLLALAGGGILDTTRILTADSVNETFRIQFPSVSGGQALTWSLREVNGNAYIGHSGETSGGSALMLLSTDRVHGIILLTNSDAYVRSEFGLTAGVEALDRIIARLDLQAAAL